MEAIANERKGYRTICMQWSLPHAYLYPSILEEPYSGNGGILAAVEWLQASALDWAPFNHRDEGYTWRMKSLFEVAESAVYAFEEFRTVFGGKAEAKSLSNLYGRIPAGIHRAVQSLQCQLRTTSLYDLTDPPNVAALHSAGIDCLPPLSDRHLAVIVALACIAEAVDDLTDILDFWRLLLGQGRKPALHFEGNFGEAAWEEHLLRSREEPNNLLHETERRRDAFAWIERAEGWLNHANLLDAMNARVEAVSLQNARKRREAAKKNQGYKKNIENGNKNQIIAAWNRLVDEQRGSGAVSIICQSTGLSAPTVRKHLKSAGLK